MPTSFTLFEILIIIGLTQGLITSALLLTTKDKQLSKIILGVTVLVFCIANCRVLLHSSGLWHTMAFKFFPVGMELFLPPLVYLYILSLTVSDFKINKNHFWHFLPGLCYAIYDISLYLLASNLTTMAAKDQLAEQLFFNQLNVFEDYLIAFLTVVYVYFGYKNIMAYMAWLRQFKGYENFPIYKWLRNLLIWCVILGCLLFLNQMMDMLSVAKDIGVNRWRFFNVFLAFVTYYLGFMGYRQDGLKVHESKVLLKNKAQRIEATGGGDVEKQLLLQLNKKQVYLEPALTLKQLASELNSTPETVSMVINQKFAMSFPELINQYRVNHFKSLVLEQAVKVPVILTLALDSGFNSQASFYRAFKKFEGMSPKEYILQNS